MMAIDYSKGMRPNLFELMQSGGGGGEPYTLPPATASTLGGVMIGSGIDVAADGTISAQGGGGSADLPYERITAETGGAITLGEGVAVGGTGPLHKVEAFRYGKLVHIRGGIKVTQSKDAVNTPLLTLPGSYAPNEGRYLYQTFFQQRVNNQLAFIVLDVKKENDITNVYLDKTLVVGDVQGTEWYMVSPNFNGNTVIINKIFMLDTMYLTD